MSIGFTLKLNKFQFAAEESIIVFILPRVFQFPGEFSIFKFKLSPTLLAPETKKEI